MAGGLLSNAEHKACFSCWSPHPSEHNTTRSQQGQQPQSRWDRSSLHIPGLRVCKVNNARGRKLQEPKASLGLLFFRHHSLP